MGNRYNPVLRQLDRIPNSLRTATASFGYAATSHYLRSGDYDYSTGEGDQK